MKNPIKILGVRFDDISKESALEKIKYFLKRKKKSFVFTPNPEMCIEANKNNLFKKVLNSSDLNICDGFGTKLAAKIFYRKNLERITGVDFFLKICEEINAKIFLLGAKEGVAKKCAENLKNKFPKIKIAGTYSGSPDKKDLKDIVEIINKTKSEILFVAFGAPKQEIFIYENIEKFNTVKIGIGIGGTFDFISGERKRAPKIMQKIGLEWLFRVILEPRRIKRIFNAVIVFPFLIIKEKLSKILT